MSAACATPTLHTSGACGCEPARTLVADPPWQFEQGTSSDPGRFRGTVDQHYAALSLAELERFPLPPVAGDAHLFLWRVSALQVEALRVVSAWGFTVKSELVWLKRTATGKRHFGMGRHVRMEHETCLIATRGRGAGVRDKSVRSTFEAPVGRHSEKPDAFYEIVERLVPGPYAELFARRARPGWTCYGDELPGGVAWA